MTLENKTILLLLLTGFLSVLTSLTHGASECEPVGDIQFICGIIDAEDIIEIPNSEVVIASGRTSPSTGSIYAVNSQNFQSREIFPQNALEARLNTYLYKDCHSEATSFQPHGVTYRLGVDGIHTLYVVGHGEREAVEVFELNVADELPSLRWVGCIVAPDSVARFNAVTSLPDGAIAVTDLNRAGGAVWEWSVDLGWRIIPGSEMVGANGIVSSEDGDWLYIAEYFAKNIVKLSRGRATPLLERKNVGYMVDNIRWSQDGSTLLLAGHDRNCDPQFNCTMSDLTNILRMNPVSLDTESVLLWRSLDVFPVSTVAIEVDEEIWLGGIRGTDRLVRHPR